jgi:hypothetical protein
MGKLLTRLPRLTLAQLHRGCDAPVNSRRYVPQRPSRFPIASMGKLLTRLPLHSCCTTNTTASYTPVNYSGYVPQRPETFPLPRWENALLTCPIRILLFDWDPSLFYHREKYVPALPAKFPSPPWETHLLLVVCRAVVSQSGVAQCQS